MYSASSGSDGGTLFQLRNLVNRRNVRVDPSDDVNSSEDFLLTVVEGHILAAAMEIFGMSSIDDQPLSTFFLRSRQYWNHFKDAVCFYIT